MKVASEMAPKSLLQRQVRRVWRVWIRSAFSAFTARSTRPPPCASQKCGRSGYHAPGPGKMVRLLQYSAGCPTLRASCEGWSLEWALNSAVECHLDTVEVAGSNSAAPTSLSRVH